MLNNMSKKIYSKNLSELFIIEETNKFFICVDENDQLLCLSKQEKNENWYETIEDFVKSNDLLEKKVKLAMHELRHEADVLLNLKKVFAELIRKEFKSEAISIKLTGMLSSENSEILLAIGQKLEERIEKIIKDFEKGNFDFYYEAKKILQKSNVK